MTEPNIQKIAVPLDGEQFSMHFGQSTAFAVFEVDAAQRKIINRVVVPLADRVFSADLKKLKIRAAALLRRHGLGTARWRGQS
jgi:predicted Fe-Mo cluster-binding NifX family protein